MALIKVDCDSVIAASVEKVLDLANARYGTDLTLSDIKHWDMNINRAGLDLQAFWNQHEVFRDCEPYADAQEFLKKLSDDGHDIVCVSDIKPIFVEDRADWLKNYYPFIPHFIPFNKKEWIKGDVLIDDGIHNIEASNAPINILFDQPWNQNAGYLTARKDVIRGFNWADSYLKITQRLKELKIA